MFKTLKNLNHKRIALRREKRNILYYDNNFSRDIFQIDYLSDWVPKNLILNLPKSKNNKIAIYSTFMGDTTSKTFSLDKANSSFDHFFISNNRNILKLAERNNWNPVYLPIPISKNKVFSSTAAKIPKALPHIFPFLNNYDYILYVDDKIKFDINKTLKEINNNNNFSLIVREHPSIKENILNELGESMLQKRYFVQLLQMSKFINSKIVDGYSLKPKYLFWTSAILRNNKNDITKIINNEWFKGILECGINCQISFDFVAQKFSEITASNDFI